MVNFSIIIPAYNEEKGIKPTVDSIKSYMNGKCGQENYEIIVVNDGSTDKTRDVVEKISGIKLINNPRNKGYGAAIKNGVKNSKFDWIVIFDADGTYPVEDILNLIKLVPEHDMAVGARIKKGAQIPLLRRPAKWAINTLANYLTASKIPDLNSGLRVMSKPLFEKFISILPDGFSLTTTITLAALTNDYKVKYIPIDYHKRTGLSKIKPIRDTLNFVRLILRTMLYFNPFKIFTTISFLLAIAGVLIFAFGYLITGKVLDITVTIFLMSSVQILVLGMISDLIIKNKKN